MSTLDQPLLSAGPSAQVETGAGIGSSAREPASLDSNVLAQICTVLTNAGVTADMMDLPSANPISMGASSSTPETSIVSSLHGNNDTDIEAGKKGGFRILRKLSTRAKSRGEEYDKEYPLVEDIYNMLFLANNWSKPFWYSLFTILNKFSLLGMILYWLYRPDDGWRDVQNALGDSPAVVKATQVLLIPVAIGITEELMITCDVLSEYSYTPGLLERHPQATKLKYIIANTLRALDGLTWLFIISTLTFYVVDLLGMYLNFAALQFLQCVDNSAFDMAKKGYFSSDVEKVANDLSGISLPSKRGTWEEYLDSFVLLSVFLILILGWALHHFVDHNWF